MRAILFAQRDKRRPFSAGALPKRGPTSGFVLPPFRTTQRIHAHGTKRSVGGGCRSEPILLGPKPRPGLGALVGLKIPRAAQALDHTHFAATRDGRDHRDRGRSTRTAQRGIRHTRDAPDSTSPLRNSQAVAGQDARKASTSASAFTRPERIASAGPTRFHSGAPRLFTSLDRRATGKSHLATALGVARSQGRGDSVYRATLAELILGTEPGRTKKGRLAEKDSFYARARCSSSTRSAICQSPPAAPTCPSNFVKRPLPKRVCHDPDFQPRFAEMGEVFATRSSRQPCLDRLLHHAVVIPDRRGQLPGYAPMPTSFPSM